MWCYGVTVLYSVGQASWESGIKSEGTPIVAYYKQYRTLRDREVQMEIAGKERMESQDKTTIIPTGQRKASEAEREQFAKLFDDKESDDDSDDVDEERYDMSLKLMHSS